MLIAILLAKEKVSMGERSKDVRSPAELARRIAWFEEYTSKLDNQPPGLPLRCPCCGCRTLSERGGFEICKVCYWEDDGQDEHDADVVRGGPNGKLSLTQARTHYLLFEACEESMIQNVRPPRAEELPG